MPEAKTINFIALLLPALFIFANFEVQAAVPARSLIKRIVDISNQSSSHESWHRYQAEITEVKAALMSAQVSENDRCQALNSLSDEELINFYDDVTSNTLQKLSKCRSVLKAKLDEYIDLKIDKLRRSYLQIAERKLTQCSDRKSATFGPEVDYFVDPEKSEILYGDFLPKCGLAFTFDDGPHKTLTRKLLTSLDNENLLVNFFVVGDRVRASPDILKEQYAQGHLIGNHTQSHEDLRKLSFKNATAEIENGFNIITKTIGDYIPFFFFFYGAHTKDLQAYLNHFNRFEFYWNIDTLDWKIKDPEELYIRALEKIERTQHGIILMHDIQPQTIATAPFLFEALRMAGYTPYLIRPLKKGPTQNVP
ncbi:MAG: polysaccharide deacetylase family protein [Bdellovibrionales bacterium]|nr:polysaccharide deacetylase family protein [Bdellovibrionales bacterium]